MLALLVLLLALPAQAQSLGCVERPREPAIALAPTVQVPVTLPGQAPNARARVGVGLPGQPAYGSDCIAVMPPVQDVLRGEPPPAGGLLRGDDGRADVLRTPPPAAGWR